MYIGCQNRFYCAFYNIVCMVFTIYYSTIYCIGATWDLQNSSTMQMECLSVIISCSVSTTTVVSLGGRETWRGWEMKPITKKCRNLAGLTGSTNECICEGWQVLYIWTHRKLYYRCRAEKLLNRTKHYINEDIVSLWSDGLSYLEITFAYTPTPAPGLILDRNA